VGHADIGGMKFHLERLTKSADGKLRCDVSRLCRKADQCEATQNIANPRLLSLAQQGKERSTCVDDTPEIHAHKPFEIRDVGLFKSIGQ